jgi:hypothetical protein
MLVLMGLLMAMPAASAQPGDNNGPGNSGAAQQCQHGGWQMLVGTDGTTFGDQGECVSFAAQGGVIATPMVQIVGWDWISRNTPHCAVSFSVSGVADGTYEAGVVGLGTFTEPLVVSGGTGSFERENVQASDGGFRAFPIGTELQVFVGPLVSALSTVSC